MLSVDLARNDHGTDIRKIAFRCNFTQEFFFYEKKFSVENRKSKKEAGLYKFEKGLRQGCQMQHIQAVSIIIPPYVVAIWVAYSYVLPSDTDAALLLSFP